jgi:hypothetical protein
MIASFTASLSGMISIWDDLEGRKEHAGDIPLYVIEAQLPRL